MKKVLFFMPDNPLKKDSGNKIRALSFLEYFKSRHFHIDFVSEQTWGEWTASDIRAIEKSNLANQVFILKRKASKKNLLYYFFCYKLPDFFYHKKWGFIPIHFPDLVSYRLRKAFNHVLRQKQYDYIFINYASWSSLIENNPLTGSAQTIIDTHDFLTAQYQTKHPIGPTFQEEIRRLSLFDRVLAISVEEQYIFSQFCKTKVNLAPMMIEKPSVSQLPLSEKKYDIIYVASKNPHNIAAARWFIKQVYPLLPSSITICIIGQITQFIEDNHQNITMIPFAEDLTPYYHSAKIAICPMLSGTGTKIKVIEALSYALPVVCNHRGIDGLINKTDNGCLVSDLPAQFKEHILTLLNDSNVYQQQSLYAGKTFNSGYELQTCYKNLDLLF